MEVGGRQRWDGVWEAPSSYTLSGSHSNQTEGIRLVHMFDSWGPPTENTPRNMVPWVNQRGVLHGAPLLSAASELDGEWWGTLIAANGSRGMSPWIYAVQASLQNAVRLYWVR